LIYPRVAATFIDEATMNKEQKRDICVKEALLRPFRPSLFSNNRIHSVARVVVDFTSFFFYPFAKLPLFFSLRHEAANRGGMSEKKVEVKRGERREREFFFSFSLLSFRSNKKKKLNTTSK
jgi:hypothetical protein